MVRPALNRSSDLLAELDLYSKTGLSNLEVLKTASGNAAKAWDIPIGRLRVGSKTNMILLNGNPTKDLTALKDIDLIWNSAL